MKRTTITAWGIILAVSFLPNKYHRAGSVWTDTALVID